MRLKLVMEPGSRRSPDGAFLAVEVGVGVGDEPVRVNPVENFD